MIFQYFSDDLEHLIFAINQDKRQIANIEAFVPNLISWIIHNMKTKKLTLKENLSETKVVSFSTIFSNYNILVD